MGSLKSFLVKVSVLYEDFILKLKKPAAYTFLPF